MTILSRSTQVNHAELASRRVTQYGHEPLPAGLDIARRPRVWSL